MGDGNNDEHRLRACEENVLELQNTLWGDNRLRNNGLRSRVVSLENNSEKKDLEFYELKEQLRHYLDFGRKETCEGLKALAEHVEQSDKERKEDNEVKIAEINAGATKKVAGWQTYAILAGVLAQIILSVIDKMFT